MRGTAVLQMLVLPAIAAADVPPPAPPSLATPTPALPPELSALGAQLEHLQQKYRELEQRLEAEARARERDAQQHDRERAETARRKPPLTFAAAPGRGLQTATTDGRFALTLRGRAQVRDSVMVAPSATTNEINVKTIRLWFSGHVLSPQLRYGIQLAFGGNDFDVGSSSPLFDAYVEYLGLRDLNIRVGQYFVPFDRARTVREVALQMVERPLVVNELSLDRDVGITFSSTNLFGSREILSYYLSVFGGEGKNRFGGQAPGLLYVLRLVVRPGGLFDDEQEGDLERLKRPRIAIGFAGAFNHSTNRARSTTGPQLSLGDVSYAHADVDVVFKYAGFSFLAEMLYRQGFPTRLEGTKDGKAALEHSRSAIGYMVQGGMMVHRLVELTARWEQLITLYPTDPALGKLTAEQGKQLGAGLNVYLNGHYFKLQGDYFYIAGDQFTQLGRHSIRMQVDASF